MADDVLLCDVFPAEVYLGDGRLLTAVRVFVTNERIVVWREDKNHIPSVTFEMAYSELLGTISEGTLKAKDRLEVFGLTTNAIVNKGRGCGCASKLKFLPRPAEFAKVSQ